MINRRGSDIGRNQSLVLNVLASKHWRALERPKALSPILYAVRRSAVSRAVHSLEQQGLIRLVYGDRCWRGRGAIDIELTDAGWTAARRHYVLPSVWANGG